MKLYNGGYSELKCTLYIKYTGAGVDISGTRCKWFAFGPPQAIATS